MKKPINYQFDKQQFLSPKDQLGYAEEYIVLKEINELLNYSLSNNLEEIEIAIFNRTGHHIQLKNAGWLINSNLSFNVKQLMYKHNVKFSMTILQKKDNKEIIINMRSGDLWFITGYGEINSNFFSWDAIDTMNTVKDFINSCFCCKSIS